MAENHRLFNNEKINVYEAQDEVAIDVFEISSSGTKPDNAILVTTGSYVPGAISVNVTEKVPGSLGVKFVGDSPIPPGPFPWKTTTIGEQIWMAENLAYDDGGEGIYKFDMSANGVNFGTQYYYSQDAIRRIDENKPFSGWHVATSNDWTLLSNQVAGDSDSLRSTSGWNDGMNGNNLNGFNALPLGTYLGEELDSFTYIGDRAFIGYKQNNYDVWCYRLTKENEIKAQSLNSYVCIPIRLVKDSE